MCLFFKYYVSVLLINFLWRSTHLINHPVLCPIISSPEPKAQGELIVFQSSHRLSVWLCVNIFKLFGGKAALGFGPDQTGTGIHGNG